MQRWLARHAPFVSPEPVLSETCLYTNTPVSLARFIPLSPMFTLCNQDEDFVVDRHPLRPHVIICAGFSGHGFKFGPIIGQAAAQLALTGGAPFDIGAFRLSRPCLGLRLEDSDTVVPRPKL